MTRPTPTEVPEGMGLLLIGDPVTITITTLTACVADFFVGALNALACRGLIFQNRTTL